jgi:hypothetical protein
MNESPEQKGTWAAKVSGQVPDKNTAKPINMLHTSGTCSKAQEKH